jgi:hypothetical protein
LRPQLGRDLPSIHPLQGELAVPPLDPGPQQEPAAGLDAEPGGGLLRQREGPLEAVTLDLARRLAEYLFRAQNDPNLRFEGAA